MMLIFLNQLIYKYSLLKRDSIENEKFSDAKIYVKIIQDLEKIKLIGK